MIYGMIRCLTPQRYICWQLTNSAKRNAATRSLKRKQRSWKQNSVCHNFQSLRHRRFTQTHSRHTPKNCISETHETLGNVLKCAEKDRVCPLRVLNRAKQFSNLPFFSLNALERQQKWMTTQKCKIRLNHKNILDQRRHANCSQTKHFTFRKFRFFVSLSINCNSPTIKQSPKLMNIKPGLQWQTTQSRTATTNK